MLFLLLASIIWAFSFGLIGRTLALNGVPSDILACARLLLAACVFLPFLRRLPLRQVGILLLIGGVQFGLMYLGYNESFVYLQPHEVALLTVFTPIYVTWLEDLRMRRISWLALLAALQAALGAALILWPKQGFSAPWMGFLLIQLSNFCFAVGQLAYRVWARGTDRPADHEVMGWLYLGGVLATLPFAASTVFEQGMVVLSLHQWFAVVYLGVIASGVGFFLWNAGARRSSTGSLAVMNNLKIPLAAVVTLVFFGGEVEWVHLVSGGLLFMTATWLSQRASLAIS